MTAFIFAGDMLVMLFMVVVVCWLYLVMPKEKLDQAARIPLQDDAGPEEDIDGRGDGA